MRVELFHPDGRTDGYDEARSHFSQFYKRAYNRRGKYCGRITLGWYSYRQPLNHPRLIPYVIRHISELPSSPCRNRYRD
jgi:hypothetical protein